MSFNAFVEIKILMEIFEFSVIITSLVMRFHECGFELQECLYQHSHQLSLIRAFIVGMNKAWTNQEGEQEGQSLLKTRKSIGSRSFTGVDPLKNQVSITCWAIISPPEKRHLNGICRQADDAPLLVVFGSPLSPHQL